jgi:predicted dehydrogenase
VPERAVALAQQHGAVAVSDWRAIVERPDVVIVIVATTNDGLAPVAEAALSAGKHVLIEKPAARSVSELEGIARIAERAGRRVRIGFNHRYHPALLKARELVDGGEIGDLMYIRGRYGHGGRLGYECEWRASPERAGGGELIDQGVHLIDLARWFLGDFDTADGSVHTYFWPMAVDDNAFLLLKTTQRQTAFLHVSCTEWKNLFSFEIFGRRGKLQIDGLGGSYGVERITAYRMLPEMGPPETTAWEYPRGDRSWELEFAEFLTDIRQGRPSAPGLADARAALLIVERLYRENGYDHCTQSPSH